MCWLDEVIESSRSFAHFALPLREASMMHETESLSVCSGSAPFSSRNLVASTWPYRQESDNGVASLVGEALFTSAPFSKRNSMMGMLLCRAASISGVRPSLE